MKDPAGGVCKEEAEEEEAEEGGQRVLSLTLLPTHKKPPSWGRTTPVLIPSLEKRCRVEDLGKVNSAEKRSIIVFLERPLALQLEIPVKFYTY